MLISIAVFPSSPNIIPMNTSPPITETERLPRIALTIGDLRGVGLELMLRVLSFRPPQAHYLFLAPAGVIKGHSTSSVPPSATQIVDSEKLPPGTVAVLNCPVDFPLAENVALKEEEYARISIASLEKAVELAKNNNIGAIVTAPVSKSAINRVRPGFIGQTEYLAESFSNKNHPVTMIFWRPELSLALVTRHLPLSRVADTITIDMITRATLALAEFLRAMGKPSPRIAVCALNPHAGEDGILGDEEMEIIAPAIKASQETGINAEGPFPADSFLARLKPGDYDGILAMYHDQGLIFFKSLGPGVNVTWGLPFVRTSPDHGPAFDLAGTGRADPASTRMALELAVELVKRMRSHR